MKNIFVYGTLLFPELVFGLTKKHFKSEVAILDGFRKQKIFDDETPRTYPAIIESSVLTVEGKILYDVDEKSLAIIDFFEEEDYLRKERSIFLNQKEVFVYVYVWNPKLKRKLKSDWDPEEFRKKYLQRYITEVIPSVIKKYGGHEK